MKKILAAITLTAATLLPASAQDFFSTDDADQLITYGARIGLNTSNRTISNTAATIWNQNAWGTGFDLGAVVNINIKNFISVQPGFFYESRSGSFAYQSSVYSGVAEPTVLTQVGKGREYLFTIPVVGSLHFNVLDELRWNVDFGPYFQIKLKSTFDGKFVYPQPTVSGAIEYFDDAKTSRCDLGLKMGTSLDIYQHYYVGVHYLAGLCHAWSPGRLGGHNKAWVFTIGYNF